MNIRKWALSLMAAAGLASVHAHAVQTVATANLSRNGAAATSPLFVVPGDIVKFGAMLTANGAANPPGTKGLGVCLEYTRATVGDPSITQLLSTDLIANGGPQALSTCTQGGATNVLGADYAVVKGWAHSDDGGWPNVALPVKLFDAQFTVAALPGVSSLIGFGSSAVSLGETFVAGTPLALCARPTVTVTKTQDGAETALTQAKFSVSLSAAVPAVCGVAGFFPISVTLGGTAATPGQAAADYSMSGPNLVGLGSAFTINFPANGSTTAVTINADPVDDTLSEGTETVVLTVVAGSGNYLIAGTGSASADITDNDVSPVTLNPATVPDGTVALSYFTQNFSGAGGVAPYGYAISGGVLPGGLALSSGGVLSGTPNAAGTFDFAVRVIDSTSAGAGGPYSASRAYRIVVAKGNQTIFFSTLTDRVLYSGSFDVSATTSSALVVAFTASNQCTISGATVTMTGVGTCTIQASQPGNANWNAATSVIRSFNVSAPTVVLNPATVPGGTVGTAYPTQNLAVSGGLAPYTSAVTTGTLPSGLSLTAAGVLSGTPLATGTFNFTVTATDATVAGSGGPFTASRAYSIIVGKGTPLVAVTSSLNPSVQGQPVTFTATVSGGGPLPTGAVTFVDGVTPICSNVALVAGAGAGAAQAQCTPNAITAGAHSITVTYPGDAAYSSATSPTYAQTVNNIATLDIDGNGKYDALTDGLLLIRYMFGLTGTSLTSSAIGTGATRTTAAQILAHIANIRPIFDADGNGQVDALTDGLLFVRYLFGVRGASLIAGTLGPGATRKTAPQIESYLQSLMP